MLDRVEAGDGVERARLELDAGLDHVAAQDLDPAGTVQLEHAGPDRGVDRVREVVDQRDAHPGGGTAEREQPDSAAHIAHPRPGAVPAGDETNVEDRPRDVAELLGDELLGIAARQGAQLVGERGHGEEPRGTPCAF